MDATDRRLGLLASMGLIAAAASVGRAQTAFTYQGRLDDGGTPAAGVFDLQFRLFNDPIAGAQQGTTVCAEDVVVADDGTFAATLDFGQPPLAHPLYLEISVRAGDGVACASPIGYETLPRQLIASSPFAVRALSADNATLLGGQSGSFFQNAANLTAGVIPDGRLATTVARTNVATTFTAPVTINNPGSSFVGSGVGLVGLNATNISSGLLATHLGGTGSNTSGATAGQVLKFSAGAWLPGTDNDTTYTAGSGLSLSGTVFSIPSQGIVAGMLATDSVDTFAIAPNAIINSDISDNSISTTKIVNNAITSTKIAAGAVGASQISDGSIGNADLQANSIAGSNIIDGTITSVDLGTGSVTTFTILDGNVASADIALDTIAAVDIAPDAVGASEIAPGAVGASELAANSVTNAALASDAASLSRVSGGAMTSSAGKIAINGAAGTNEFTVNGKIESTTGLTTPGTITAAEFVHQTPFPRTYSLGPYDVTVRDGGVEVGEFSGSNYSGQPFLYNTSVLVSVECVMPVHLPDAAVVTGFKLYAADGALTNITAQLLRRAFDQSSSGTMAQVTTSGEIVDTVRTFTDTTISAPTIDNDAFMYYVRLEFPATTGQNNFKGIVIDYTVLRPLP